MKSTSTHIPHPPAAASHMVRIQANPAWWRMNWSEVWDYRDLMLLLVKRDLTAVYKQTILGPLWFVIQPLLTTVVFTVIFGTVANIPTDGIPSFLFYMSGMVFWNFFQGVFTHGANSLIVNANVLTKVYFPRLTIPLSGILVYLAHFGLNLVLLVGFYLWYVSMGAVVRPGLGILLIPLLVVQCALMALGFGLWVSSLTVKYRDLRFALPFLIQLWMYATPIVYPASLVENALYRGILWLNPMTAIVEFARKGLTGQGSAPWGGLALSAGVTALVLISGLLMFNRAQRTFADTI